jgi:glycosyltransferase involved in cell wall biosynthesis
MNQSKQHGRLSLPEGFLLSVIVPVFNEVETIDEVLQRVRAIDIPCEVIVVDDGSTDGTRQALERIARTHDMQLLFQERNRGKGAALKRGFAQATGDVVAIQDGDLEYDPQDLRALLEPIVRGEADVVYGSRFMDKERRVSTYFHRHGNQLITRVSNLRTGLRLTDVETCYKVMRRALVQQITPTLREQRFGVELEITAKLARLPNVTFLELPIRYQGRSYSEGKKIGWRDALRAMWCIMRY